MPNNFFARCKFSSNPCVISEKDNIELESVEIALLESVRPTPAMLVFCKKERRLRRLQEFPQSMHYKNHEEQANHHYLAY